MMITPYMVFIDMKPIVCRIRAQRPPELIGKGEIRIAAVFDLKEKLRDFDLFLGLILGEIRSFLDDRRRDGKNRITIVFNVRLNSRNPFYEGFRPVF